MSEPINLFDCFEEALERLKSDEFLDSETIKQMESDLKAAKQLGILARAPEPEAPVRHPVYGECIIHSYQNGGHIVRAEIGSSHYSIIDKLLDPDELLAVHRKVVDFLEEIQAKK